MRVDIEKPLGENDLAALISEYRGMEAGESWRWIFDEDRRLDVHH